MYINREYSLQYFREKIFSDSYIVITSNVDSERSKKFFEEFPNAKFVNVDYCVELNSNNELRDTFNVTTNFDSNLADNYDSLYQELQRFIKILNSESQRIIIDISSMHLRFLGAFLAVLSEYQWKSIICTYTETTGYPRSKEMDPVAEKHFNQIGGFDLNSSFWGYNEVPNLKTVSSDREDYVWIVFLGFEGKRSAAVYNEISDDANTTIPVITVPSVKPGWANYAFEANQILFENAAITSSDIRYVDALNPFATYNFIEQIKTQYPNRHLVISPLGTRPVSLGVLLYALLNEESEVYFDTPKEVYNKIISNGKIHIYDVLSFYGDKI